MMSVIVKYLMFSPPATNFGEKVNSFFDSLSNFILKAILFYLFLKFYLICRSQNLSYKCILQDINSCIAC